MAMRRERTNHRSDPMSGGGGGGGGALGLQLNKKLGQHLLKNPGIVEKIVNACDIKSTDTVLEIGPGTGNLTMKILPLAKRVVALDIDGRMVAEVKKRANSAGFMNIEAREGDALRACLGRFDVCTGNMPYQISSPFIFRLLAHRPLFKTAILMFQKEFSERLLAKPGDDKYGRLAVNTQLFCKVTAVCKVSAGSFNPPPQVDSMVVKLVPRDPPLQVDFGEWDGLMRICFKKKRKTLAANFNDKSILATLESNYKTFCALHGQQPASDLNMKELTRQILEQTGLSSVRAVTIDIDTFFGLLLAFNRAGVHFLNVGQRPLGVVSQGGTGATSSWQGLEAFMDMDDEEED
uniref:rRNA adenine N(6)-methyltransferase n=1 Tax=Chromera velia CCMP2878 TaxID=1169474 RepID=A0A0G4H135_9ALVE|eukprot:Cvel_5530.t1-p1 / transcript=Cvel_5530.t1 / gene=Cvel_5530 / organism=Chromera_velia_CCMP2878 / gene_product=Probable dimethyladenosine transferase, putative / transcript_product=Probable dimethyladenosine transferase, putative / location=Cvel_scaffold259:45172-48595(+) / protein_length=348 / sequence_SO=supercontig / SO=protein_coding / is_pseudo=false